MFEWYKKEKPFFTGITRGVGGAGFGKARATAVSAGAKASGGTIIPSAESGNGYTYHVFLYPNSDNFVASSPLTADVLIVAGGGGGAVSYYAGGGGAGGAVYGPNISITATTYSVTVGAGGGNGTTTPAHGQQGTNSSFNLVTAIGGGAGAGGNQPYSPSLSGGSAGGSHGYSNSPSWRTKLPQPVPGSYIAYGNDGGGSAPYAGGGGGGAGSVGGDVRFFGPSPTYYYGGVGGNGQPFPAFPGPIIAPAIPTNNIADAPFKAGGPGPLPERAAFTSAVGPTGLYAGGGGGGLYYTSGPDPVSGGGGKPAGGTGGGADGAGPPYPGPTVDPTKGPARNAVSHTGGGGGGGNYGGENLFNGSGGRPGAPGIVIIRYLA